MIKLISTLCLLFSVVAGSSGATVSYKDFDTNHFSLSIQGTDPNFIVEKIHINTNTFPVGGGAGGDTLWTNSALAGKVGLSQPTNYVELTGGGGIPSGGLDGSPTLFNLLSDKNALPFAPYNISFGEIGRNEFGFITATSVPFGTTHVGYGAAPFDGSHYPEIVFDPVNNWAIIGDGEFGGVLSNLTINASTILNNGPSGLPVLIAMANGVPTLTVDGFGVLSLGNGTALLDATGGELDINSSFTDFQGDVTFDGSLLVGSGLLTPTGGILGKSSTGNATAGNVGEYVESIIASGSAGGISTATATNITSISLTAGDWDVSAIASFTATTATTTAWSTGISTASATVPTTGDECYSDLLLTLNSGNNSLTPKTKRISIAGTTTVFLVGKVTFSAGTVKAFGSISARRVQPGA